MAVSPEGQGLGVGRALLVATEGFGVSAGNCRLLLSTTRFLVRARRLYESSGFVVIGNDDLYGTPLIRMEKLIVTDM